MKRLVFDVVEVKAVHSADEFRALCSAGQHIVSWQRAVYEPDRGTSPRELYILGPPRIEETPPREEKGQGKETAGCGPLE